MGRKFSREFKREAVALVLKEGQPVKRVADNLGIWHTTLTAWVKLEQERENAAGPSETELLRTRMKELERENKRLKMERDILKKAAAYFAKEDEENSDG